MNRYICIHGHFYQPPRENAWLEEIEVQDSAAPFHDWNERVASESYAPNSASRILDSEEQIVDIVNNYARISFDAGPTLLTWMQKSSPALYQAILDADRESRARFHGHGSAIAQAYNHLIMPLANSRDKRTQILWGIRDFESRFSRKPEGLWLPETAVDLESLDIMAELDIAFAILAPHQAAQVRRLKAGEWEDAGSGRVDPKMPYLCNLPSGRAIAIFFYDGPISHNVAFGGLLRNGELFAKRLMGAFDDGKTNPELVHIATDGETYGHHHRFGDMALAYCLHHIETNALAEITVYGDYLERFPPTHEVRIADNTSWSCCHGIERWRADCGDSSGANPGWNQKWRAPLRNAMEWLRGKVIPLYEKEMLAFNPNPWDVRDDYIGVILDRSVRNVEAFFSRHFPSPLTAEAKVRILKLLELQRHAMLIFTSDGWFFDDISNVETIQVIQYAARVLQLIRDVSGAELEPEFLSLLEKAVSNVPEYKNGAHIYDRFVRPAIIDFLRLAAHYAVSSLFETYPQAVHIAHYQASSEVCKKAETGTRKLATGKVKLKSEITWEERTASYAVLHFGDQNLIAGVQESDDDGRFRTLCRAIEDAFDKSDMTTAIRLIDQSFGTHNYSLWHLFKDEKRKVLDQILETRLRGLEAIYRQIYESNYAIMQAINEMQIPLPEGLATPAEFVLNADLLRLLAAEKVDIKALRALVKEYKTWLLRPDKAALSLAVSRKILALMKKLSDELNDASALKTLENFFNILKPLSMDMDLWESQNIYFSLGTKLYGPAKEKAARGDAAAKTWLTHFERLGTCLRVQPAAFLRR